MALFCTPCWQRRFVVHIQYSLACNQHKVVLHLHNTSRSLILSLTYKDCPPDKRGLRRTQICHLIRWVRTPDAGACCMTDCDRAAYPVLFVSSKHIFSPAVRQGSGSASSQPYSRQTPVSSRPWGTCGHWSGQTERRNTRSSSTPPVCESRFDLIHHRALQEL